MVSTDIKKEFDSEPVHNKYFFKTEEKSHSDEVTDFYNKEVFKMDSNHTWQLAVSTLIWQLLVWILLSENIRILICKCF